MCTVRYGGFTVNPETAYTKTFGVVLKPRFLRGLTVSADRFLIDLTDSIGFNYDDFFYNGCCLTADPFYCSKFARNADGTLFSPPASNPATGYIRAGTTNYYQSKSHGWDFQAQYDMNLATAGKLNFLFDGSLATLIGGQDATVLPEYNCANGYYGGPCGQIIPKWAHGLRVSYATQDDKLTLSGNWRHVGPLTNISNSGMTELGYPAANARTDYYRDRIAGLFRSQRQFRGYEGVRSPRRGQQHLRQIGADHPRLIQLRTVASQYPAAALRFVGAADRGWNDGAVLIFIREQFLRKGNKMRAIKYIIGFALSSYAAVPAQSFTFAECRLQ